jgi:hypothetical protein
MQDARQHCGTAAQHRRAVAVRFRSDAARQWGGRQKWPTNGICHDFLDTHGVTDAAK